MEKIQRRAIQHRFESAGARADGQTAHGPSGVSRRRLLYRQWLLPLPSHLEVAAVAGILLLVVGYWGGGSANRPWASGRVSTPDLVLADEALESTPEVRFATRGAWVEASGPWSEFGILGAAFDGQRIALSTAESARGSLSCWISPGAKPMRGACSEASPVPGSKVAAGRSCSWQLVVLEISPTTIRGARMLNMAESDPGCRQEYPSLPSSFAWERPKGRTAR